MKTYPLLQSRVYRPKWYLWVLFLCSLIFTGAVGYLTVHALADPQRSFLQNVILVPLFVAFVLVFFWSLATFAYTRLEVSEEGLALYQIGFHLYTPWHNLARISWVGHPRFPAQKVVIALLLREPAVLNVSIREGKRRGAAVVECRWAMQLFRIPPERYHWFFPLQRELVWRKDWENGYLGEALRHYAPQVVVSETDSYPIS